MKRAAASLLVLALCGCTINSLPGRDDGLPRDVSRFIENRRACDHFRNDAAFDDDSGDFQLDQSRAYCTGTDADLARLKEKHAGSPEVQDALRRLEAQIESEQ